MWYVSHVALLLDLRVFLYVLGSLMSIRHNTPACTCITCVGYGWGVCYLLWGVLSCVVQFAAIFRKRTGRHRPLPSPSPPSPLTCAVEPTDGAPAVTDATTSPSLLPPSASSLPPPSSFPFPAPDTLAFIFSRRWKHEKTREYHGMRQERKGGWYACMRRLKGVVCKNIRFACRKITGEDSWLSRVRGENRCCPGKTP